MSEPLHVVGAAIVQQDRCLAARRGPQMALPGKWEFPGGKVERDEDPRQALARELKEELEIVASIGDLLGRGTAQGGARPIQLDVYAATIVEGVPTALEHDRLRWVNVEELHSLDWAEADIPVLEAVARLLVLLAPV